MKDDDDNNNNNNNIIVIATTSIFIVSGAERGKEIVSYIVIAIALRKPRYYILCSTQLVTRILQWKVDRNIIQLFTSRWLGCLEVYKTHTYICSSKRDIIMHFARI
jgi:hypothetical protein